jgi:peptidyl-prolyl cis-trans isomerase SurA
MRPLFKHTLALSAVVLLPLLPASAADEVMIDGIAAQVGTDIVLVSEVMDIVSINEVKLREAGASDAQIMQLRSEGLETMIEWRLIERIVKEAGLEVSDTEVDATIESIATENGLTVAQLKKSVTSQDMDYESYRSEIKRELERRKVVNGMVASRVTVDEEEVEKLYTERFEDQPESGTTVHLAQIMVPADPERGATTADACKFVGQLRQRIEQGEPFEAMALQYSAAAPQQGGDIGWLHMDSMASWMVELIEPLEAGDISPVAELPFACTIVKLVERREWKPVSYADVKESLHMEVFDSKLRVEYGTWMEELRDHTFIERRGYFADAASFGKSTDSTAFEQSLQGYDMLGGGGGGEASTTP